MGVLFIDRDYTASVIYERVWNFGGMTLSGENRNTSEKIDVSHKSRRLVWDRTLVSAVRGCRLTVRATVWLHVLGDTWYICLLQLGLQPMAMVGYLVKNRRQLHTEGEIIHKTIQTKHRIHKTEKHTKQEHKHYKDIKKTRIIKNNKKKQIIMTQRTAQYTQLHNCNDTTYCTEHTHSYITVMTQRTAQNVHTAT